MAVLRPLKVIITNLPEGQTEWLETENNPEDIDAGKRPLAFTRELYIEQDDFMENPPPKYFRLSPGSMTRLKSAFIIRCDEAVKDEEGNLTALHCTYIPESRSGQDNSGLNVKGVIHWLSAEHAKSAEIRLYDRLFQVEDPAAEEDFKNSINPYSLEVIHNAFVEPALLDSSDGDRFQFMRIGYFCKDIESSPDRPIFNRTVNLKDSWKPK